MGRSDVFDCRVNVGVAKAGQAVASALAGRDGGEAPPHIAAVGLDVQRRQGLDGGSLGGIEVPQRDQVIGQRSRLVAGPGVERGDELRLLDQAACKASRPKSRLHSAAMRHPHDFRSRAGDSRRRGSPH
jgi:hypothetical protein